MGCCTSFSATTGAARSDPTRHVNFTTGMVLGVDDYRQEFAYHQARGQWMARELSGYGTTSGLEVTMEDDEGGPRLKVSSGTAVTPSGQMICVGREQCGALNPWMQQPEIAEKLDAISAGSEPQSEASFSVWLTLCYIDCAVAPVPVPGEPCRSDEELMAPSRIADDYNLSFEFAPPFMTEAEAIRLFGAWTATILINASGEGNAEKLPALVESAAQQLDVVFPDGIHDPAVPESLDRIHIQPRLAAAFSAEMKRLWITRYRPRVMAVRCGVMGENGDHCIMLSRVDLRAVRSPSGWQVANVEDSDGETDARLDQSDRPLLLAGNMAQTKTGSQLSSTDVVEKLTFISASGSSSAAEGQIIIISDDAVELKLVKPTAAMFGNSLTIRLARSSSAQLFVSGTGTIGGNSTIDMDGLRELRLRAEGSGNWAIQHTIERGS